MMMVQGNLQVQLVGGRVHSVLFTTACEGWGLSGPPVGVGDGGLGAGAAGSAPEIAQIHALSGGA